MKEMNKVISLCNEFVEANGIEVDKNDIKACVFKKLYNHKMISAQDLNLYDIDLFIAKIDSDKDFSYVDEKLGEALDNLIMLILASSAEYNKRIERVLSKRKLDNSNIKVLMIGSAETSSRYSIGIKSRIQALYDEIKVPKTRKTSEKVSGGVYSASLYDIVSIYNELGDELFKKNVRLRVKKDNIGVGKEIKDTLRRYANQFWFLNNGITIVTNSAVDLSNNTAIHLYMDDNRYFSVVNGAQTISAAHDFFFCDGEEEEVINRAKEANVLLRVVSVENINETNDIEFENNESMSERISKSLNRQKPIEQEDLAYYSPFVKNVNSLYADEISTDVTELDNRFFGIIRRGENESDSENSFEHSLTFIARAIRASGYSDTEGWRYLPWKAVNTYNADILKLDDDGNLKHKELFKVDKTLSRDVFLAQYQYVNLAIFIYQYYAKKKNSIDISKYKNQSKIEVIKESGTWYFVSFFFEYLLENKLGKKLQTNCISDFNDYISERDFVETIEFFFEIMDDDKSGFKLKDLRKEDTYTDIKESIKSKKRQYTSFKDRVQGLYVSYEDGDLLSYKDYDARVKVDGNHFILIKGSVVEEDIDDLCAQYIKDLREEYKDSIVDGILNEDVCFDDLSTAAKFVEGRRLIKGYKNWIKRI